MGADDASRPTWVPEDQGALRQALQLLGDEDFEELVHALVLIEHPAAQKLAAPDGGADTLLPSAPPATGYSRVWQVKRYTEQIWWPKCVESLDRARRVWGPPRVTFVFARNLNANYEQGFNEKLRARHEDVAVDWWGTSELLSRLGRDDDGRRVARRFLNLRPHDDLGRQIRAKGELSNGADALDRMLATGEFTDDLDPDYEYDLAVRRNRGQQAAPSPDSVIRLERIDDRQHATVDAIARNADVHQRRPVGGVLRFDESPAGLEAAKRFKRILADGGTLDTDHAVTVEFHNLPAMFTDLVDPEGLRPAKISLARPAWQARWTVASPEHGIEALDIDFSPSGVPPELRATGRAGGLQVALLFSPSTDGSDRGTLKVDWKYRPGEDALDLELKVLKFVRSLVGGGTAQLEDRCGRVDPLPVPLPAADPDPYLETMWDYLTRLQTIERHLGRAIARPPEARGADLNAVWEAADAIERGGRTVTVEGAQLTLKPGEGVERFITEFAARRAALPYTPDKEFTIFGESIVLGTYAVPLPPGRLIWRRDEVAADGDILLRFEADPASAQVWATLQRPAPARRES